VVEVKDDAPRRFHSSWCGVTSSFVLVFALIYSTNINTTLSSVSCTHFGMTKGKGVGKFEDGQQRIIRSVAAATNPGSASKDVLHPKLHNRRRGATHSRQGKTLLEDSKLHHTFDFV
jgi:hypothetical protein